MRLITLTSLIVLLLVLGAQGQTVNSGSSGADGPLLVGDIIGRFPPGTQIQGDCRTACTYIVPLRPPPNHIYNFTTISIVSTATVRFQPNIANTPVFLLATYDVTINGTIDVSGESTGAPLSTIPSKGGPGGFSGGLGAKCPTC